MRINKFMKLLLHHFFLAAVFGALLPAAHAQSTSGVPSPGVKPGTSALEYRIGVRPAEDGAETQLANRFHYQRAVSDAWRWRMIGQLRGPADDQKVDQLQGQLLWDLSEDDDRWRTGLRFDAIMRNGAGAEELRVN